MTEITVHKGLAAVLRKDKAFGVCASALKRAEKIKVIYSDGTVLTALSKDILNSGLTNEGFNRDASYLMFDGKLEYFLPLKDWKFESGNKEWLQNIYDHFKWTLNKGEK
jgi:hypothetical protein